MILKKVSIRGFRSIAEMDIPFEGNGHKVLVGKNETGKSNILKALGLLSGTSFEKSDRKYRYDEEELAYVRFVFSLDSDEFKRFKAKIFTKIKNAENLTLIAGLTVEEYVKNFSKEIYRDFDCGKAPYWDYIDPPENTRLHGMWYLVQDTITELGVQDILPPGSYLNKKILMQHKVLVDAFSQRSLHKYLRPINLNNFHADLSRYMKDFLKQENTIIPLINWKYNSSEHDLPKQVDRQKFCSDPNLCIPLKNMFRIFGIAEENIGEKISATFNPNSLNRIKTLYNDVSKKTNKYLKDAWSEFEDVKIDLYSDGGLIGIGIVDKESTFDFNERSDGFRRLVSFLLLMATEKKAQMANRIILIDEPETGLHPSSAKNLRNKIIELGENNLAIYATHSISMIDTDNIKNNLVVTKEDENTKIKEVNEDGKSPAENVYAAIGYSIYEEFKKTNIVLEGYTDKKTFKFFMQGNEWKDIGTTFANGTGNIPYVVALLELGDREYFVLSDADKSGAERKKDAGNPEYWFTYKDLNSDAVTVEDIYKRNFFFDTAKKVCKSEGINISIPTETDSEKEKGRLETFRILLKRKKLHNEKEKEKEIVKNVIKKIKYTCANDVIKNQIDQGKMEIILKNLLIKIKKGTPPTTPTSTQSSSKKKKKKLRR